MSPNDGCVEPFDAASLQSIRQSSVRDVCLGHDEKPGRVPIEAVNDAGPLTSADVREPGQPPEKGVDERPGPVARCRMHDHARCLVDDHERIVLVNDVDRQLLRLDLHGGRCRYQHVDARSELHGLRLLGRAAIHPDAPLGEELLHPCARKFQSIRDESIEASLLPGANSQRVALLLHYLGHYLGHGRTHPDLGLRTVEVDVSNVREVALGEFGSDAHAERQRLPSDELLVLAGRIL